MENRLPKRNEVPVELTWNLEDVYKSVEDWQKEMDEIGQLIAGFRKYEGKILESAQKLYEVLNLFETLCARFHLASGYAQKIRDTDNGSSFGQSLYAKVNDLGVQMMENTSFLKPEIIAVEEEKIQAFFEEKPELEKFRNFIRNMRREKEHALSPEMEKLMAGASRLADLPYETFGILVNAELKFPNAVDAEGNEHILTNGRFIPLMESKDRVLRKDAFEKLYEGYKSHKNTLASLYAGQVNQLMFFAKNRKYANVREAALDQNEVAVQVYDNLIEAIHENMDKMYRYVRLRKKMLGLEELHIYDGHVPIVGDYEVSYTFEEAKEIVLKSLEPLGEEYTSVVKRAFNERWIDVVENEGKRSGAYASGMYGAHPFVLLNFNGTLSNVFTLTHEMGHAMHSYYSNGAQPFLDSQYSIFVAEVASTTNEVLLIHYLLNHAKSEKEKAYILNHYLNSFKSTIYRQTMFAEFEKKATELAESGIPLNSDNLTELYYQLNQEYFGPDMILDERIGYEWLRVPHFYFDFYVYQYATGYSSAVSIATRILEEGEPALKAYKNFLKSGCTSDPVSLLKIAGVDMTTKEPIHAALKVFDRVLGEMEELHEKGLVS